MSELRENEQTKIWHIKSLLMEEYASNMAYFYSVQDSYVYDSKELLQNAQVRKNPLKS